MTAAAPADDAFPAVEEAAQPAAPADDDLLNLDLTAAAPPTMPSRPSRKPRSLRPRLTTICSIWI